MREFKAGTLRSSSGRKVRSRKQAIAIALSQARKLGARIPETPTAKTRTGKTKPSKRFHATKKSPAQLQGEIDEVLAKPMAGRKTRSHAPKSINPEYLRKTKVAGQLADDAWLRGGLDAMDAELKWFRRNDADPVIIGEFERLYHNHMRRVLPKQRLAR